MDITGNLKQKSEEQQISDKFKKREFVITDNSSQYPQHLSFQLTQDKCNLIDKYNIGDEIKVHFNLRGREWTSPQGELRHFNTLEAWRLEGGAGASAPSSSEESVETSTDTFTAASEGDDLPF